MDEAIRIELEAAAFRRVVEHLRERIDVQNILPELPLLRDMEGDVPLGDPCQARGRVIGSSSGGLLT
jgi:hypothetical protein